MEGRPKGDNRRRKRKEDQTVQICERVKKRWNGPYTGKRKVIKGGGKDNGRGVH